MAGKHEGILINKCIYRNFDNMAVFRFLYNYVNYIFLLNIPMCYTINTFRVSAEML